MLPPWLLVPALIVTSTTAAPPPTAQELDALEARLRATGPEGAAVRIEAAEQLAAEPPSGFELYVARLKRPPKATPATLRALVIEAGGAVPNPDYPKDPRLWLSKPDPPWIPPPRVKGQPRPRRPPPHDPEQTDWIKALGALDVAAMPAMPARETVDAGAGQAQPEKPDASEQPGKPENIDWQRARAEALETVALLRALGASRLDDALGPIFDLAFEQEGVYRDECGRAIRALGDYAVAGLIERQHAKGNGAANRAQWRSMRRYAAYQLDRMDRAQPRKAIAAAPDDRVRASILHAYGEVRALDAVEPILDQVDAAAHRVRREARWAWLRYVAGPPPPEPPKRKRKLPGGREEKEEKEDYLNYRQMAVLALNHALTEIADGACTTCARVDPDGIPSPQADAAKMTEALFAYYDHRRAAAWDVQFNAAAAKARSGDLRGAIADFSAILAHDPLYARRAEIAGVFFDYGEKLLDDDPARALPYLRQAVVLDPGSERSHKIDARIHLIDGEARMKAGVYDPADFRRALALDPTLDEARAALDALDRRQSREGLVQASGLAAGGLALLCVGVALWRLKRRRGAQP